MLSSKSTGFLRSNISLSGSTGRHDNSETDVITGLLDLSERRQSPNWEIEYEIWVERERFRTEHVHRLLLK